MLSPEAVDPPVSAREDFALDFLVQGLVLVGFPEAGDLLGPGLDHVVESVPAGLYPLVVEVDSLLVLFLFSNGRHNININQFIRAFVIIKINLSQNGGLGVVFAMKIRLDVGHVLRPLVLGSLEQKVQLFLLIFVGGEQMHRLCQLEVSFLLRTGGQLIRRLHLGVVLEF